jgi:hypothetical protein
MGRAVAPISVPAVNRSCRVTMKMLPLGATSTPVTEPRMYGYSRGIGHMGSTTNLGTWELSPDPPAPPVAAQAPTLTSSDPAVVTNSSARLNSILPSLRLGMGVPARRARYRGCD